MKNKVYKYNSSISFPHNCMTCLITIFYSFSTKSCFKKFSMVIIRKNGKISYYSQLKRNTIHLLQFLTDGHIKYLLLIKEIDDSCLCSMFMFSLVHFNSLIMTSRSGELSSLVKVSRSRKHFKQNLEI